MIDAELRFLAPSSAPCQSFDRKVRWLFTQKPDLSAKANIPAEPFTAWIETKRNTPCKISVWESTMRWPRCRRCTLLQEITAYLGMSFAIKKKHTSDKFSIVAEFCEDTSNVTMGREGRKGFSRKCIHEDAFSLRLRPC